MKRIIKTAAIAAASAALISCSVKEDRTHCPCYLGLDITSAAQHSSELSLSAWNPSGEIFSERVSVSDYPDFYERAVPKGMVTAVAFCGLDRSTVQGRKVMIPEGAQSDMLKVHSRMLDCTGEETRDSVILCRQYATVHLSVSRPTGEPFPYEMKVVGDVCGIDLVTLEPIKGAFSFMTVPDADGTRLFRLPRQGEGSRAELSVLLEGRETDRLPLHEWIARTGYSWLDRDLKDIYVTMDFAMTHVSVTVQGWDSDETLDIVI